MAVRRVPGEFLTFGSQRFNLADSAATSAWQAVRTPGDALVSPITIAFPALAEQWTIQSVAIQAYLALVNNNAWYGLMGKLIAAIAPPTDIGPTGTLRIPMPALPTDPSLLTTLWDGSLDICPPTLPESITDAPVPSAMLPVAGVITPSQDILIPGEELALGLWQTPSLVSTAAAVGDFFTLAVFSATYILQYDDGRK